MAETIPQFQRFLEQMSRDLGWTMQYTALYTANWMCRDSLWYTPPFVDGSFKGTTKDAGDVGEAAVARDIAKIFTPMDARMKKTGPGIVLNRLATAAKLGRMSQYFDAQEDAKAITFNSEIVNRIVRDPNPVRGYYAARNYFAGFSAQELNENIQGVKRSEMRALHDKLQVRRNGRLTVKKPANYLQKILVRSKGDFDRYVKERQKMVGKTKSGWFKVMRMLPKPKARGRQSNIVDPGDIAAYIKNHSGSAGYKSYQTADKGHLVNLLIGNSMADVDSVSSRTKVQEKVEMMADRRLAFELNRQVQDFCDMANRS
jgi:hypothetical protein